MTDHPPLPEPTTFASHIRYPATHTDFYYAGTEWVLVTAVIRMGGPEAYQGIWVCNDGRMMHCHDDGTPRMPPGWELVRDAGVPPREETSS